MLLDTLGLQLPDLVAGTAGGVCNVWVFKRTGAYAIAGAVIVGAVTGAYFGLLAGKLVPYPEARLPLCLILGFGGGAFLKVSFASLIKRFPSAFNGAAHD